MTNRVQARLKRMMFARFAVECIAFLAAAVVVTHSAVMAKQQAAAPALVALHPTRSSQPPVLPVVLGAPEPAPPGTPGAPGVDQATLPPADDLAPFAADYPVQTPPEGYLRYFDGRPIRPVKTIWMTVTAYSPDERSCPGTADGYTATNHSVWTNAMKLVAADPKLLPYGSILTVPGYADGAAVPVLDCGGAIKGRRLDVLYPTHEIARQWGRRRVAVTVWEYADGKPSNLGHRKRG
ncbi:MAG: 3D domain-containing protein [Planctomycetota bacterium]|nr:3D domain-containing protein [Planctomycetota bacterium]